ncbi:MAG: N-acetylmuramoyl-L-alanine amidase [Alcaligenaceae bacterium]|nr:N-acetylmuramoyl-L-alanine amidase [Alcaligenaceae bacterium]
MSLNQSHLLAWKEASLKTDEQAGVLPSQEHQPARRSLVKFLGGCFGLSLLGVTTPAFARTYPKVVGVRGWSADEYTRLTIELTKSVQFKYFTLKNPRRLVVDLVGFYHAKSLQKYLSNKLKKDPYVRRMRAAQFKGNTVRLVIDLKQEIIPQIFVLKPVGRYKYRLVIDLYPKVAKDPLSDLLDDGLDLANDDPLKDIFDELADEKAMREDVLAPLVAGQIAPKTKRKKHKGLIIAIDPGHGGEDTGAIGSKKTKEKDVVLSIAHALRKKINAQRGMTAYMTRDSDYFVPLHTRVLKAQRVKADLFISIHADAARNHKAQGMSVFVLSERGASSSLASWIQEREELSDKIGGVNIKNVSRSKAKRALNRSLHRQIKSSLNLGRSVFKSLSKVKGIKPRRIEHAGFAVLKSPEIPSILVETSFISNPQEARFLRNHRNQEKIAEAILKGVKDYLHVYKKTK